MYTCAYTFTYTVRQYINVSTAEIYVSLVGQTFDLVQVRLGLHSLGGTH